MTLSSRLSHIPNDPSSTHSCHEQKQIQKVHMSIVTTDEMGSNIPLFSRKYRILVVWLWFENKNYLSLLL